MKNNNKSVIRRLSGRSLRNNKMRNLFALAAIALTCMLFTVIGSMGIGIMQITQESTMIEVGTKAHAGLKSVTKDQMEKITSDRRIKDYTWNILVGSPENLERRYSEVRYAQGEKELENSFVTLEEGTLPENAEDIVVDTLTMDELKIPHKLGEEFPVELRILGEKVTKTYRVCGWYEGTEISHASQLYISKAGWEALRGDFTEADFQDWMAVSGEMAGQGLYDVNLDFGSPRKAEEKVVTIIRDAGYEPETEVDYGVNWAYMQSRVQDMDISTVLVLTAAVLVVILSGYLIIYNIFQISIMQDIRFYGLLKTIGTTKRQIKALVRRQALVLSLMGIPLGLAAGFLVSKVIMPFVMSIGNYGGANLKLRFHPAILVFGVVFSLLTVMISCRKPGKIAGSVSPVEAVRYSEGTLKRKKEKKSEKGGRVQRMALSNLGRNKKKTILVIFSLSFSVMLLCVVLTGAGSFQIDQYLESRLVGDVTIGSTNYTSSISNWDFSIEEEYLSLMDAQPGIIERNEIWTGDGRMSVHLDDQAFSRYEAFEKQGVLRLDGNTGVSLERTRLTREVTSDFYAYSGELLEKLKVRKGTLDVERFLQGGYILVSDVVAAQGENTYLYEPGDKVILNIPTKDTEGEEILDEQGEIVALSYTNMEQKQYEVMAVVGFPNSLTTGASPVNGLQCVISLEELKAMEFPGSRCIAVSYEVEKEALADFNDTAKAYAENQSTRMGYVTKASLMEEFGGMINVIRTIGVALAAVIAFIGILNFINSIFTGIIARKGEFAILCSIGMTQRQLKRMLILEGLYYVLISGGISIVLGSALSYLVLRALNQVILFFNYQYDFRAFVIMLPLFAVIAVAAPGIAYRKIAKTSIVERLREF